MQTNKKPIAYIDREDLNDLCSCNGRSIWAENPTIHEDCPNITAKQLVPVYTHPPELKPIAWRWLYNGVPDSEKCFPMPGPDETVIYRASKREFPVTVQYLYTF